jgi:hypothetical protein
MITMANRYENRYFDHSLVVNAIQYFKRGEIRKYFLNPEFNIALRPLDQRNSGHEEEETLESKLARKKEEKERKRLAKIAKKKAKAKKAEEKAAAAASGGAENKPVVKKLYLNYTIPGRHETLFPADDSDDDLVEEEDEEDGGGDENDNNDSESDSSNDELTPEELKMMKKYHFREINPKLERKVHS